MDLAIFAKRQQRGVDGHLHGGVIFRGTITSTITGLEDGSLDNNVYDESVPIALWHDTMEGTYAANTPIWVPISYTDRTAGGSGIYGGGSDWQTDNSSAAEGVSHWRISDPDGGNYASNTVDMLKFHLVRVKGFEYGSLVSGAYLGPPLLHLCAHCPRRPTTRRSSWMAV